MIKRLFNNWQLGLFNIWDAGSAKAIEEAGAKAIATGSWSVAAANGFGDGENLPFEFALANLERIVSTVDAPVTIDIEGGYATDNAELKENIKKLCELSPLAVNIMVLPDTPPPAELAKLGVSRISYGPGPYRQMTEALKEAGRKAFSELS